MDYLVPNMIFFTKGVGRNPEKLCAFEMALRDAGIAQYNLVKVSSIFPPNCRIIPRSRGLEKLKPGQIVHCVMSQNDTNEPNRLLAAAIGLAIPAEENHYGYISEHHSFGETDEKAGDYSEDLAATMLATTLGIDFDPDKAWDERKEVFRMSERIVKTRSWCKSARGDKNGLWVSVVAAAVFVFD